jgi:O-antigen ligase
VPSYPQRPPASKANSVQAFRGENRASVALHPSEYLLVVVVSLHLCLLPWLMGARAPWAQVVSLVFALVGFFIALWPRHYTGELAPAGDFTLHPWSRLPKFPIFWLGLLFLGYVLCQALNPSWVRTSTGTVWYLERIKHIEWLPSGVSASFAKMNAWRMLTIWSGVWLVVCALWMGLTRRVALQTILTALVVNGVVLGLIGILQKMTNATDMLWFIKVPAAYFHATFVYKNHAGAYFNIIVTISGGLLVWHHLRGLRKLDRSSPSPVFAFGVILLGATIFMSGSRTAMLLYSGYIVGSFLIYIFWRSRTKTGPANPLVSAFIGFSCCAFIAAAVYFLDLGRSIDQIKNAFTEGRSLAIDARIDVRDATYELFLDEPVTGWGAGSFRHTFPIHQYKYPDVFRFRDRIMVWDHAHNDFVQFLAEVGLIGVLFPVLGFGWALVRFGKLGAFANPAFMIFLLGFSLTLAHGWMDFPLYNCAIITTLSACFIMTLRWSEMECSR